MNRRLYYDQWAADVNLEEELADLRERNEELHNMQLTQMVDEPRFGRLMIEEGIRAHYEHIGNIGRRFQIMIIRMAPTIPAQLLQALTPNIQMRRVQRFDNWQYDEEGNFDPQSNWEFHVRRNRDERSESERDQEYIMDTFDDARVAYRDLVNEGSIDDHRNPQSLHLDGDDFDSMQTSGTYWGQIANIVDRFMIRSPFSDIWVRVRPYLDMETFRQGQRNVSQRVDDYIESVVPSPPQQLQAAEDDDDEELYDPGEDEQEILFVGGDPMPEEESDDEIIDLT